MTKIEVRNPKGNRVINAYPDQIKHNDMQWSIRALRVAIVSVISHDVTLKEHFSRSLKEEAIPRLYSCQKG